MERETSRADRADPDGPEQDHQKSGVARAQCDAGDRAYRREDHALDQQTPSHRADAVADRAQEPDFPRPLLDAETEQQPDQHRGRDDQEHAESEEQPREVGGAGGSLETLGLDRTEGETGTGRR